MIVVTPTRVMRGGGEQNSAYGSLRHFTLCLSLLPFTSHAPPPPHASRARDPPHGGAADPGTDPAASRAGTRTGACAADDSRIQAEVDAGRAAAPRAAREVSGHRHP